MTHQEKLEATARTALEDLKRFGYVCRETIKRLRELFPSEDDSSCSPSDRELDASPTR